MQESSVGICHREQSQYKQCKKSENDFSKVFTLAKSLLTIAKAKYLARKSKLHRQNCQRAPIKEGFYIISGTSQA